MAAKMKPPPARKESKGRGSSMLEPVQDFQPNVPRLHLHDDMCVITVNGESKGLIRRLGAGMFFWSHNDEEGRVGTEEEAFHRLGFELYFNNKGAKCVKSHKGGPVAVIDL